MSWTKLDDLWSEQDAMRELDFESRWHLLTMVQSCSRSGRFDGFMRRLDALRCSDVPDPDRCLAALVQSPFLAFADGGYRLTRDDYFPPEYLRDKTAKPRSKSSSKSYRERKAACDAGDHSERCPRSCSERDQLGDQSRASSPLDGTGRAVTQGTPNTTSENDETITEEVSWPETAAPGTAKTCAHCGKVSGFLNGGFCLAQACIAAARGRAS